MLRVSQACEGGSATWNTSPNMFFYEPSLIVVRIQCKKCDEGKGRGGPAWVFLFDYFNSIQ